jgi:hypothetical protein
MQKQLDTKKLLGFRQLPSMSETQAIKKGADRNFNKIGSEPAGPARELDHYFNKIGTELTGPTEELNRFFNRIDKPD